MSQRNSLKHQRGVTLVEALVAMVIMAFGMIALVGLLGQMRRTADVAKQRGEAVRIAQREIEQLRDYSVIALPANPAAGVQAYDSIVTPAQVNASAGAAESNATFALQRTVTPWLDASGTLATAKQVSVLVTWLDRANDLQTVQLHSVITRADPGLGGALSVAPVSSPVRRPSEREASIPVAAKDLGDKTSAFKPLAGGTLAWLFNNLTGAIIGRCTVPMGTPTAALLLENLTTCDRTTSALLLSGYVRFSLGTAPDADAPSSTALPLDMTMAVTVGAALTPNFECYDDAPAIAGLGTQTAVSYYCAVYPDNSTKPSWSGSLVVSGITLGSGGYNICRYSADYDGNKAISNAEHPLKYAGVTAALTNQNFLVVRGSANCPAGHSVDPSRGLFSNTATVLHQPDGVETPTPN